MCSVVCVCAQGARRTSCLIFRSKLLVQVSYWHLRRRRSSGCGKSARAPCQIQSSVFCFFAAGSSPSSPSSGTFSSRTSISSTCIFFPFSHAVSNLLFSVFRPAKVSCRRPEARRERGRGWGSAKDEKERKASSLENRGKLTWLRPVLVLLDASLDGVVRDSPPRLHFQLHLAALVGGSLLLVALVASVVSVVNAVVVRSCPLPPCRSSRSSDLSHWRSPELHHPQD